MTIWKIILGASLPLIVFGCKTREVSELASANTPQPPAHLEMCAAVRGNGNYIFTQWGALARILEHYGPIDGIAGGSSGSVTAFLYESIYMNPAVWECPSGRCSEHEAANRMAFLMKSLREFVNVIGDRVDFGAAATAVPKLIQRFKDQQYEDAVKSGDLAGAAISAIRILSSPELGNVIDHRIIDRLTHAVGNPSELKHAVGEIQGAVAALNWDSSNPRIVFERGLIDFEELTKRVGIAGDFYAGKDLESGRQTKEMLDSCAAPSVGFTWREAAKLPGPSQAQKTCGEYYQKMANEFFARFNKANKEAQRLSDPVGGVIPTLTSTAIYNSTEADDYTRQAYKRFNADAPYVRGFSSDWLKFGYWGKQEDLDRIQKNERGFTDLKSSRFVALGQVQWGEAMRVGPQEPGLGSILCNYEQGSATQRGKWDTYSNLPDGQKCERWSLGAWSDLYPVQVLKNMGCERVVYVTRRDDEGAFVKGVVQLLTRDEADWQHMDKDLFDLDNKESSAAVSLGAADAVLCSDWNSIGSTEIDCLGEESYSAPFQVDEGSPNHVAGDDFFKSLSGGPKSRGQRLRDGGFQAYGNVQTSPPLRGCMLGAPKPAAGETRPSPCKK
jgi:hypothetical protein